MFEDEDRVPDKEKIVWSVIFFIAVVVFFALYARYVPSTDW